jgi:hypothetical protein
VELAVKKNKTDVVICRINSNKKRERRWKGGGKEYYKTKWL